MDSSMADQLHRIDQQLLQCELLPGEEAAIDDFRVWSLQYRQQRHSELGHFPDDMVERSAWQAKKQQLDELMVPEIESERLLRGRLYLQGAASHDWVQHLSADFESEKPCPATQVSLRYGRNTKSEIGYESYVERCLKVQAMVTLQERVCLSLLVALQLI